MASKSKSTKRRKSAAAKDVQLRLQEFVTLSYGSWGKFERATAIPHATTSNWKPARDGFPNFESLVQLSRKGLSLDWLFTGQGPMILRIGETREGLVAEMMRPSLMRLGKVGPEAADLAFTKMVLTLTLDKVLEISAIALLPQFLSNVEQLRALTFQGELLMRIENQLFELHKQFGNGSLDERTAAIQALRETLLEQLPEDFRPHSPMRERILAALRDSVATHSPT